jgi:hypothetical protein
MDFKKQEIQNLLAKRAAWRNGEITIDQMLTEVAASNTLFKWAHFDYKVALQVSPKPKDLKRLLVKRGLIGDGLLVDIAPEAAASEMIYCEAANQPITREECKNRSGDSQNISWCHEKCETDRTTRALVTNRLPLRGPEVDVCRNEGI